MLSSKPQVMSMSFCECANKMSTHSSGLICAIYINLVSLEAYKTLQLFVMCYACSYAIILNGRQAILRTLVKQSLEFAGRPVFYLQQYLNPRMKGTLRCVSLLLTVQHFSTLCWYRYVICFSVKSCKYVVWVRYKESL